MADAKEAHETLAAGEPPLTDAHARALAELEAAKARAQHLIALHTAASAIRDTLLREADVPAIHRATCRLIVELGLASLAWIGVYDDDADVIVPVERAGVHDGYERRIRLRLRDETVPRGPAVRALETRAPSVVDDIAAAPDFQFWELALACGIRSCAVFPILVRGRAPAVLAIYAERVGFFGAEETALLASLTESIMTAIERVDAAEERRAMTRRLEERVKELSVVHGVARLLQSSASYPSAPFTAVVARIPAGLSSRRRCVARLAWDDHVATSGEWPSGRPTISAPFWAGGKEGRLEVTSLDPTDDAVPFPLEEHELVRSIADMVATHVARSSAELDLLLREELSRAELEASEAVRLAPDVEKIAGALCQRVGRCLDASATFIELDRAGDRLVARGDHEGDPPLVGERALSGAGVLASALDVRVVVVRDLRELSREDADAWRALGAESFVAVTVHEGAAPRARLLLRHRGPRHWNEREVALAQSLAERGWDAMKQRRAEAELVRSETQLRLASEAARIGAWTADVATRRVEWSDQLFALHEMPVGEPPTWEHALATCAREHRPRALAALAACVEHGTPFDLELELVTARKKLLWVRVFGQAERDANGRTRRVHGAFQDIDERRRIAEQRRQAQKMEAVGRLAGGVAHDFNNLVSVILGYSSLILRDLSPDSPLRADLQEIERGGQRATELTRQLLTFSREQVLEPRAVSLNRVVIGMQRMLERAAGSEVRLDVNTAAELWYAFADPNQVEQVILNLVVNARDAMPNGGSLTLETANTTIDAAYGAQHGVASGDYVVLTVTDTGHGMTEEIRARIFEPFFTTKAKGTGTGLGLAIAYGIVTQSGGHIAVHSEPDAGTSIKVYFPRRDDAASAVGDDGTEAAELESLRGTETVLVVEDSDPVRAMLCSLLRRAGYTVIEARDGGDALIAWQTRSDSVDLLLTDLVMPRMSGRELARRLRRLRPNLRVVFMSGFGEDAAAVRHGAVDSSATVVAKPIRAEALLTALRAALAKAGETGGAAHDTRADGARVMLVDDEEPLIALSTRVLSRLGYRVAGFDDPRAALAAFTADPASFDAVVTDVSMPDMNGFELVRALRGVREDVAIVVTSGAFRAEDASAAAELGLHGLVVKPNTVDELGVALDREIRRRLSR